MIPRFRCEPVEEVLSWYKMTQAIPLLSMEGLHVRLLGYTHR